MGHFSRLGVIVHYVKRTAIRPEMVCHGGIGVCNSDFSIAAVRGDIAGFKEHLQIHHVIDNDRELPTPLSLPSVINIPALDAARRIAKSCRQGSCCGKQYLLTSEER